jgi:hypothetical protein
MIKKYFKMLGFIHRNTSNFKNIKSLKTYFSLVRSHLEFASILWLPSYYSYKDIENAQYTFLKLLCYKLNMLFSRDLYDIHISHLGLSHYNLRRNVVDIITYDLLNDCIDSPKLLSMILFNIPNF